MSERARTELPVRLRIASGSGHRGRPAADRPERDPAPARGDRALPRRSPPRGHDPRRGRAPRARPAHRSSRRVDGRTRRPRSVPPAPRPIRWSRSPGASPRAARSGPRSTPSCCARVREHTSTIVFVNNRRAAERVALRLNELAAREDKQAAGEHGVAVRAARDRPRPPRLARARGAHARRGAAEGRRAALPRRHQLARARHRHGRRRSRPAGRVAQVRRPRAAARRARRPRRRRGQPWTLLPQVPRRPARVRRRLPADARRCRSSRPSCRATPSTCSPSRSSRSPSPPRTMDGVAGRELHALVTSTWSYAELSRELLERVLDMLDGRYPDTAFGDRSTIGLRPRIVWDRLAGIDPSPPRRAPARGRKRRHDPRPRPLHRHAPRRPPRRRARRGDGLRGSRRPGLHARRLHLADRGDRPRPRDRHPGPRRARRRSLLEGRHARAPRRARPRDRRLLALGHRAGRRHAPARLRPRRARRAQPARLPARAAGRHARAPLRSHDRARALSRRDRRLARCACSPPTAPASTPPGASRCPPACASATAWRPTRCGPTTASSCACPTSTSDEARALPRASRSSC